MSFTILQLSNPYDALPTLGYGGVGRVATVLHEHLDIWATVGAPGSQGSGLFPAESKTPISIMERALGLKHNFDIVLTHHAEVARLASEVFDPTRVIEVIHMPVREEIVEYYKGVKHRLIGASSAQLQLLWFERSDPAALWHGTPVVAPGEGKGGYLVWVGRWSYEKGVLEAIAAAKKAGVKLLLIGAGTNPDEERFFKERIEPELSTQIEAVVGTNSQERDALVGNAAGLLAPTRGHEAFGLVLIEAAMLGTPVLAYPHSATAEIVGRGLGAFASDSDQLAEISKKAICGEFDRNSIREAAIRDFSAQAQAERYKKTFNEWFA